MKFIQKLFCMTGMMGWVMTALVAVGQAADDSAMGTPMVVPISPDGVQRAVVTLDSYSYAPNHLVVESGKPVELTLSSITTITPHNFVIHEPSIDLWVEQDVGAGKTLVARFVPLQPGRVVFFCDKRLWPMPSHRAKGMEGILEIK
jgi:plastocyanin